MESGIQCDARLAFKLPVVEQVEKGQLTCYGLSARTAFRAI